MPRVPRLAQPGLPQHTWLRGHDKQPFLRDEKDRIVCLRYIEEALGSYDCHLHAYVLMTNHIHLLLTGQRGRAVSDFMHGWSRRFAFYFNRSRRRSGALYEGRFRSNPIRSDHYFLTCMRYIEMNPVRASMVERAAEYPWSSHRANASGAPAGMLTAHELYLQLGGAPAARALAYTALFEEAIPETELQVLRVGIVPRARGRAGLPLL